jgi:hypothetical protein
MINGSDSLSLSPIPNAQIPRIKKDNDKANADETTVGEGSPRDVVMCAPQLIAEGAFEMQIYA